MLKPHTPFGSENSAMQSGTIYTDTSTMALWVNADSNDEAAWAKFQPHSLSMIPGFNTPTPPHTLTFPSPCNSRQHERNKIQPCFSLNYSMLHTLRKTITVPRQPGEIKAWSAPGESMIKSHTYLPLPGPIPACQMKSVRLLSNMPITVIKPSWVFSQEWDMVTPTNTHTFSQHQPFTSQRPEVPQIQENLPCLIYTTVCVNVTCCCTEEVSVKQSILSKHHYHHHRCIS